MGRVIVDTSVLVTCAAPSRPNTSLLRNAACGSYFYVNLIIAGDAVLLGVVRQELLTGIANGNVFDRVSERLR